MEEKQIVNVSVANGGVAEIQIGNESVEEYFAMLKKSNIVKNEDLVKLGFPNILIDDSYRYNGKATKKQDYKIQCDLYNALYVTRMLYEKYNNKTFKLEHRKYYGYDANAVWLGNEIVFYLQTTRADVCLNIEDIYIRFLVAELLEKIGSFEKLKEEFSQLYEKEKAKIELNEIVIHEKQKFIEALKSNRDFAKKQISYYLKFAMHFGENYTINKANLKSNNLSYLLRRKIFSIHIYKNLLIISTARKNYVIELNEAEKQKLNEIITSLKL